MKTALDFDTIYVKHSKNAEKQQKNRDFFINKPLNTFVSGKEVRIMIELLDDW